MANRINIEIAQVLEDASGGVYEIMGERASINQNSHSQYHNSDFLCHKVGTEVKRWVSDKTIRSMHAAGGLTITEAPRAA